jgi:AcrR family transcriptional regulator
MSIQLPPLREGSAVKRTAIARAALDVFVRDGSARANVDAIAANAGVSKRTIYDYYGNKDRLFLLTMQESRQAQLASFRDLLERTLGTVDDIGAALTRFGREFAAEVVRSPDRAAVLRVIIAEARHFPALLEPGPTGDPLQRMLADRLAELAADGWLAVPDPMEAAEFLDVLMTARVRNHSWYGTVQLDDERIAGLVAGGVRIFLQAYGVTGAAGRRGRPSPGRTAG